MEKKRACLFVQKGGYCAKFNNGQCQYGHPAVCRNNTTCYNLSCTFRHDNDRCEANCSLFECALRHPKERTRPCMNGSNCLKMPQCAFLHPKANLNQPSSSKPLHSPVVKAPREIIPKQFATDLERLLHDKLRLSQVINFARAIKLVKSALYAFDKNLHAARKSADRQKQRALQAEGTSSKSKATEELAAIHANIDELTNQRRSVTDKIYGIVNSLTERSLDANKRISRELYRLNARLPALAKRGEIEDAVAKNQFVIIQGSTGSGKSTQIPQYLADMPQFSTKKILCTQPRKLAAISLAERVAFEYAAGYKKFAVVGGAVGYKCGGAKKLSAHTRIEYTTESSLLAQLNVDNSKQEKIARMIARCGAIVVDEAHERNMSTDLLLGILKSLAVKYPHLKIIITSATLDTELFSRYFGNCPIIQIPGRMYPVDIIYKPVSDQEDVTLDSVMQCVFEILKTTKPTEGDILSFLTGQDEVERAKLMCQRLSDRDPSLKGVVKSFCLYGKQTPEEQQEVFAKLATTQRKVIFATDVAETSLTIDGVRFVIDSGLTKDAVFDPNTKLTTLKVQPISKSSAVQRKGRAGRTSSGVCYRLYSENDYNTMRESTMAELFRRPLSLIFATLLSMGIDPYHFDWLEPPNPAALDNALRELTMLKAIAVSPNRTKELTKLGRSIAELQADPGIVHMLAKGCSAGLGQAACAIAGLMSVANIVFWRGNDVATRQASDMARMKFLSDKGDVVSLYRVYTAWVEQKSSKIVQTSVAAANDDLGDVIEDNSSNLDEILKATEANVISINEVSGTESDVESDVISEANSDVSSDSKSDVGDIDSLADDVEAVESHVIKSNHSEQKEDAEEEIKSKSRNVRQWCKDNFVNNKAMMMATTLANELRRGLTRLGIWNQNQTRTPSEAELQRLAFDALVLNFAVRQREGSVQSVLSKTVACVHPSSSLFQLEVKTPPYVVFNTILRTSRVFISTVTPVDVQWLQDYKEIEEGLKDIEVKEVRLSAPSSTLRVLMGKFNANAESLGKQLNCQLEADFSKGILTAWTLVRSVQNVKTVLEQRIKEINEQISFEIQEEELIGETRIVWGVGGEIVSILQGNEFISANFSNLAPTMTESKLRELLAPYGPLRGCTLITSPSNDPKKEPKQWANVVFKDAASAKRALEMKGEFWDAKAVDITPSGIKKPSMFKDMRGQLVLSFANGPSLNKAIVIYGSATEANALLQSGIFAKMFPIGNDPKKSLARSNLPPQVGRLFQVEERSAHTTFTVTLEGLSADVDEFQIMTQIRQRGLSVPNYVSVKRAPAAEVQGGKSDSVEIAEMQQVLPSSLIDRVVNRSTFLDEKRNRGGISFFVPTPEDVTTTLSNPTIINAVNALPNRFSQPVRLEGKITLSVAIHVSLWKQNQTVLEQLFRAARANGVVIHSNEKSSTQTIFDLQSTNIEYLQQVHRSIEHVLQCIIFQHQQKGLLFSWLGRQRLQKLSEDTAYIHWDHRTLTIRIYGNEDERAKAIKMLEDLIAELNQLVLDKAFIIKRPSCIKIKRELKAIQNSTGVMNVCLKGTRLFASGTRESIDKLQKRISSAMKPEATNNNNTDECPICTDTFVDPVTLQACNHSFCKECLQDYFGQPILPLPLCCPLNCKPMITRDILALVPLEAFAGLKQSAVESFIQKHPAEYTHCPKKGCPQYLRVPQAVSVELERKNGGRLTSCDQCNATYCYPCSEFYQEPIRQHSFESCQEKRAQLTPTLQQHVRHIESELLNSACPRCKTAFLDFEGCCAVTCQTSSCRAGFCGLCLIDTNGDAHSHVRTCPLSSKPGEYFHSMPEIIRCQGIVKRQRVVQYLRSISVADRVEVLKQLVKNRSLSDLKIDIPEQAILQ